MNEIARLTDQMIAARNGDRFDELLSDLLPGDENSNRAAAHLLALAKPGTYKEWRLIVACGEHGVSEAVPELRTAFSNAGAGRQDARIAALYSLTKVLGDEEAIELLVNALDDRDIRVAEAAAIEVSFYEDAWIVPKLRTWLAQAIASPRTKARARITSEVIAVCNRLSDPAQADELRALLSETKLTALETLASEGRYAGQRFNGIFPQIEWPI